MNRHWKWVVKVLIFVGCIAYFLWNLISLGLDGVWQVAQKADPKWLLLSLIPLFLRFFLWSLKWFLMLSRQQNLSFSLVHQWIMAAAFINLVTPTAKLGGAIYRGLMLKKNDRFRSSSAYGWVVADQLSHLFGNLVLFGGLCLAAPWILPQIKPMSGLILLGAICMVLAVGFVLIRPYLWHKLKQAQVPKIFGKLIERRLTQFGSEVRNDSMSQFLLPSLGSCKGPGYVTVEILGSAVSFAMLGIANVWILRSLGADASVLAVLIVVMVSYLAGSFLGVMGGIGVTEVFLLKLYPLAGILPTHAAAGAILHRGLYYLWVLVMGGWAFWGTRKKRWD